MLGAKHCNFTCTAESCTAEDTAVRDQIIIGLKRNDIRQEALKKSWDLDTLWREGMKMEGAARGEAEINGEDIQNGCIFVQDIKGQTGNKRNIHHLLQLSNQD